MRPVRIFIAKKGAFWFFNNIKLGPHNKQTEVFDYDTLSDVTKRSIDKYHSLGVIFIKETTEPCSDFKIEEPNDTPEIVPAQGIPDFESVTEPEDLPELVCVPEPPPIKVEDLTPTEEDLERARALMARNGNTIRKTIKAMDQSFATRKFVYACIEAEKAGKNRDGILRVLEDKFISIPPSGE